MSSKIYKNGMVVGKFAPETLGHINLINRAALFCEKLTVILCFDEKWLSKQNERDRKVLTLKNRLLWLSKTFENMPHINIVSINETNLPAYPNGWKEYANLLRGVFDGNIPEDTAIFSSEKEYDDNYKKYLPEVEHCIVDSERKQVPISATMIREDLFGNWDMLPSIVRSHYALKVNVIGESGTGKTTLVKALAKQYNTSWVEDSTKDYINQNLAGDGQLIDSDDFETIALMNKALLDDALKTANKIVFIDSNHKMLNNHHERVCGEKNELISLLEKKSSYDLTIELSENISFSEEYDKAIRNVQKLINKD